MISRAILGTIGQRRNRDNADAAVTLDNELISWTESADHPDLVVRAGLFSSATTEDGIGDMGSTQPSMTYDATEGARPATSAGYVQWAFAGNTDPLPLWQTFPGSLYYHFEMNGTLASGTQPGGGVDSGLFSIGLYGNGIIEEATDTHAYTINDGLGTKALNVAGDIEISSEHDNVAVDIRWDDTAELWQVYLNGLLWWENAYDAEAATSVTTLRPIYGGTFITGGYVRRAFILAGWQTITRHETSDDHILFLGDSTTNFGGFDATRYGTVVGRLPWATISEAYVNGETTVIRNGYNSSGTLQTSQADMLYRDAGNISQTFRAMADAGHHVGVYSLNYCRESSTIAQVESMVSTTMAGHGHAPTKVILSTGITDALADSATIQADMTDLIDAIVAEGGAGTKILVRNLTGTTTGISLARLNAANTAIAAAVAARTTNAQLLDVFTELGGASVSSDLFLPGDGIHFSAEGHIAIGNLVGAAAATYFWG